MKWQKVSLLWDKMFKNLFWDKKKANGPHTVKTVHFLVQKVKMLIFFSQMSQMSVLHTEWQFVIETWKFTFWLKDNMYILIYSIQMAIRSIFCDR